MMNTGHGYRRALFTPEIRNLIIFYRRQGFNYSSIAKLLLLKHSVKCSKQGVSKFLKNYGQTGNVNVLQRYRRDRFRKVKTGHRNFIDLWMHQNQELTAVEIRQRLKSLFRLEISVSLIRKIRKELGWTGKKTEYCAMISGKNRLIREHFALEQLRNRERFQNVVFVDETTIEMRSSGRFTFHKNALWMDATTRKAPKPKHGYKVHMWAGISYRGRTDCCLFTGIMDSEIYQQILERNFLPWVNKTYPDGYRLYQDNDSKHKSKSTKAWFEKHNMTAKLMDVPASSPDINPIENVWHALKDTLHRVVKPKTKKELVLGIVRFWENLDSRACGRYIDHIHYVLPEVILNNGGPTKY